MRIAMKRILPLILTLVALTYSSCSLFHDDVSETEQSSGEKPTLTLSVASLGSRTALPSVSPEGITSYKLIGEATGVDTKWTDNYGNTYTASSGIEWRSNKSGNTTLDSSRTAYDVMKADRIGIAAGTWKLTLTATQTSASATATYVETKTVNIGSSGNQALTFNLSLSNLNAGANSGALSINVKLTESVSAKLLTAKVYKITNYTYDNGIVNGKTETGVKLTDSDGFTYSATADAPDEVVVASQNDSSSFASDATIPFVVNALPAGEYYVVFTFYDDTSKTNVLATWREAAYVSALGAVSTINVGALDSTYPVTYLQLFNEVPSGEGTIQATVLGSGENGITCSNQAKYSRSSAFDLVAPSCGANYTFWRWVEVNFTGEPVNGVYSVTFGAAKDSHVAGQIGPKYYMAQFFDADAYKQIDHITLTDSSASDAVVSAGETSAAVGHTVKATAYSDSTESEANAFKADLTWVWQYADSATSNSWTDIPASGDIVNTSSGVRTSSLKIRPAYAGKFLRAYAVQTYKVTGTGTSAVVTRNDIDSLKTSIPSMTTANVTAGGTPVAATVLAVANGTLTLSNDAKFTYGETAEIGSTLQVSAFTLSTGTVHDAVATDWVYANNTNANTFTDSSTVTLATTAVAPFSSGLTKIPLTFTVAGYNSLVFEGEALTENRPTAEGGNVVNINVKAKTPLTTGSATLEQLLIELMDKNLVNYNKIRFTTVAPVNTTVSKDGAAYPTAITPGLEYSFDNSTWNAWKTTETPAGDSETANYLVQEIDAANQSKVYVRTKATGTSGSEGYVAPSAPVEISLTGKLGTLVRLSGVTISTPNVTRSTVDKNTDEVAPLNNGSPKVGSKTTVSLTPEVEGQSISATKFAYEWKIGETVVRYVEKAATEENFASDSFELASANADLKVYNGAVTNTESAENPYTISNDTIGKTLSVTVTPTYQTSTASATTYPESTRTAAESAGNNAKSASGTIAKGTLQFSSDFALAYGGTGKKMIPGTRPDSIYVSVTGIARDSLEKIVLNSEPARLYNAYYVFDSSASITGATMLRFKATGFNDALVEIDIPTTQIMTNAEVTEMLLSDDISNIPLGTILFKESTDYKYYMFEYRTSDTAPWLPVPNIPFSAGGTYYPDTDEYFTTGVKVRFKATYTEGNNVFYYNSYEGAAASGSWVSYSSDVLVPEVLSDAGATIANAAASGAIDLELNRNGKRYVGGHCALVTVKIQNDEDVKLSLLGKNVIYVVNDTDFVRFTWYLDENPNPIELNSEDAVTFTVGKDYIHTGTGTGKFTVRVVAENALGDLYSATAVYTKTN